jgi:hypothetical protein
VPRPRERRATVLAVLIAATATGCQSGAALSSPDGSANSRETGSGLTGQPLNLTVGDLIGAVGACPSGYAHPNVCCQRGVCTERPATPFAACSLEALTFPDRSRCCSLDRADECVDAPKLDVGVDGGVRNCSLPCSPGGKPAGGQPLGPCTNQASQVGCAYCCEGLGCTSNICHCPPLPPNGGSCACNTPTCDACPAAWMEAGPQVDLCCRSSSSGSPECFSQAVAVNSPAEGGSIFSGPNGCEIYHSTGGHTYDVACDVTLTPQCTCSLDGATTMSFPFANAGCSLTECGFSPWPR